MGEEADITNFKKKDEHTMKIHLVYWILICVLTLGLNYKNILSHILNIDGVGYLRLEADVELINPMSGDVVGFLNKGAVLKYPKIDDLDDVDLGDNDRYKIYVDLVGIGREYRTYFDGAKGPPEGINLYNTLDIKLHRVPVGEPNNE